MRRVLAAVAVLLVLLMAATVALILSFDGELLGREVLRRGNEIEGVTVSAQNARLALFSGLELGGASATVELESGRLVLQVDRVTLRHDFWSLLRGRIVIEEIVLERPQLELRPAVEAAEIDRRNRRRPAGRGGGEPPARSSEAEGEDIAIAITSWRIENGSLRSFGRDAAEAELEVDGLTLDLHDLRFEGGAGWNGLFAVGSFQAAEIRSEDSTASGIAGEVFVEAGKLRLEEVELDTGIARLAGCWLHVDLNEEPSRYALKLSGEIDLGAVLGVGSEDRLGPAELLFEASGAGREMTDLTGEGTLHLASGEIPSPPMILQIERLLGREILTGASYAETEIRFRMTGNEVEITPFELVSEHVRLRVSGLLDLEGPIDLRMEVHAPVDSVRIGGTGQEILVSLLDPDGWLTLPFRVSGTLEEPDVEPDWETSKDVVIDIAVEAARKALEDEGLGGAVKLLDRLIEKNRN